MTYLQKKFDVSTLANDVTGGSLFGSEPITNQSIIPAHLEVAAARYETLDVELDTETSSLWCFGRGSAHVSQAMADDTIRMQETIRRMFADRAHEPKRPFEYFVLASRVPGTFNLGGDLALFGQAIRSGDRARLRRYAYSCIEVVYNNHVAFDVPVTTIALVQGDALGGGFECALSTDLIIAERGVKMGLPEVMFNLFPGMGAYSFLSRRLDAARAEKMILSGRIYSAEELHEMGVVDILAEDGMGEEAVREYIDRQTYRRNAYRGVFQTRRRVNPITKQELLDVVDIWVESALNLQEQDLRRMARLAGAQERRREAMASISIAAE
jgi:DSF synthase